MTVKDFLKRDSGIESFRIWKYQDSELKGMTKIKFFLTLSWWV